MAWLTTPSPWNYRKLKYVTNNIASTLSNYQMQFTLRFGSGTDTGTDVYLNGNANSDFSDVRFTDTNGTTLLNYWFESVTNGVSATVWVKVPSIPPSGSSPTYIYIYYSNSSQTTSLSNGVNTFVFFDDFSSDLSKWTVSGATINSGRLSMTNASYWAASTQTFTQPFVLELKYTPSSLQNGQNWNGEAIIGLRSGSTCVALDDPTGPSPNYASISRKYVSCGLQNISALTHDLTPFKLQLVANGSNVDMAAYELNDTFLKSWTGTPVTVTNLPIRLGARYDGNNSESVNFFWDDIRVRKYASPGPTWQIANAQETYTVNLTVSSTPSGARIHLNGGDTGQTTTYIFPPLYPGSYDVLLKKVGYQDWFSGVFTLESNQTYVVTGNLSPALITATNMTLDKTTCLGACTVVATITWNNPGSTASFEPAIVVDGVRTGSGSIVELTLGQTHIQSFNIPLGVGSHNICPDPN